MVQYQVIWHVYFFLDSSSPQQSHAVQSRWFRAYTNASAAAWENKEWFLGWWSWRVYACEMLSQNTLSMGGTPSFEIMCPKKTEFTRSKKCSLLLSFHGLNNYCKTMFWPKITFEIEKSKKKLGSVPPSLLIGILDKLWKHKMAHGFFVETQNGTWPFCVNTKWQGVDHCHFVETQNVIVTFCVSTKCHYDILCFHKLA